MMGLPFLQSQRGENTLHLLPGGSERSGVIDYKIGSFDFFFVGNLRRHAASYFGAGSVFRNSQAAGETQNALFGMASHDDETVETAGRARFQDECGFDDGEGVRIALADLFHPLIFLCDHGGMDNLVEFLDPRCRAERGFSQPRPVDASVGIQDFAAEVADNFLIDRAPGFHQPVRDGIGLNQVCAEFDKHPADHGFAARDTASEAEF